MAAPNILSGRRGKKASEERGGGRRNANAWQRRSTDGRHVQRRVLRSARSIRGERRIAAPLKSKLPLPTRTAARGTLRQVSVVNAACRHTTQAEALSADTANVCTAVPRMMSFLVACVTKHVEVWFTPPSPSFSSSCRRLVVTSSNREYLFIDG